MLILSALNFIIGIVVVFFTIIIFHPNNKYRKLKSKEDQLFLQKTFLTMIYFISILVLSILNLLNVINSSYYSFLVEFFGFNAYVIVIVLYNFFMAYELYSTYDNPVHYFNRIFRQKRYNYMPEFIIFIVSIIVLSVDIFFFNIDIYKIKPEEEKEKFINDDNNGYYYCNFSSVFIIVGRWKQFIILLLSLISFILFIKIKRKISKFCFKKQEKLYNSIDKRAIDNTLYILYGIYYVLPVVTNLKVTENYNIFGSILFLIIILQDILINISIIAPTKFCEYCLKRSLLGYFCSFFNKSGKNAKSGAPLVNETSINEGTGITTINETTSALDITSNNIEDKELVSIYKNGIFLEDHFLYYFDQILNIISSSIFNVYNSKNFSSEANEQRLSNRIKIGDDVSCIGGAMQSVSVSNIENYNTAISSESEVGQDIARFELKKNLEKDDLRRFKEVLEYGLNIKNNNNYLNINVKSFFTPKCVESIYEHKMKGRYIGDSLISHMILKNYAKNKNLENPNAYYWSLLASNGKEQYFNKSRSTSIKTYDKNFNLDIIETNDEEVMYLEGRKNSDLAILLDEYFAYISGDGIKGTFIPLLVGVFKIKINDFKTLLVFVTKNSFVDNVPKNYFTYWQLIRFFSDKPEKIASSQITKGNLVKDDSIFERSFQIETIKDNPNYNKIFVKNYADFQETIMNDIKFLKSFKSQNFNLLLMYYEYESTQKHEKQGAIKIKQTGTGTEIVEESFPKGLEEENFGTPINIASSGGSGGFLDGGFLDDNDFAGDNFMNNNNKNMAKIFDANEKVNITSYEGVFDSFNCMCFFTFENVFDVRKRFHSTSKYYQNFEKKVMVNFTNYKK